MRPVDPRLLRYARSTRRFLVLAVVLGVVTAVLVITQARLLSSVIVDVTANGLGWAAVASSVLALACVFAARAAIAWLAEIAAFRSSARAKQELRSAAFAHVLELGPAGPGGVDPGGVAALITRGVDGLDGYFARYLPQLVLAVIVPIAVLLTVLGQDLLSTLIIAVTLPLIPVFMILIGIYTRGRVDRQWGTLAVLSGHFLDLVAGLPTLKVFGRAKAQASAIRAIGDEYRSTTMGVLRISFLSSLALELLATLSVALVAVSVGLRLAEGQIAYSVALFVLVLAPEAYLPLRLVGQHFHAAAEGLGAADRMFQLLETPPPVAGGTHAVHRVRSIEATDVTVTFPGRAQPALSATSFTADRGTVTAISQSYKIRHTQTVDGRVAAAREALGLANQFMDKFDKDMAELIQREINEAKFLEIVGKVYPKPEENSKGALTKWENKVALLQDIYNGPTNNMIAGTAWGALNAMTERLDWYRSPRNNNTESIAAAASGFDVATNSEKARILSAVRELTAV